jgi:ABC-type multidrug transport system fused ATPase/permease subunit
MAFDLAGKLAFEKYCSYLNKSYGFYNDNNTAVLLRNFSQLPFDLVSYLIIPFIAIVNELFVLLLIVLSITFFNPLLFWSLIFFTAPLLIIYNRVFKKQLKQVSEARDGQSATMFKSGHQSMEAYREIVLFNKKEYFKKSFKKNLDAYGLSNGQLYFLNTFSPKVVESVAILGIFSIFISGYLFNKEIAVLAQFLLVFALAAYKVIPSLNKIILFTNYIKSSSYIFQHFDTTNESVEKTTNSAQTDIVFNRQLEIKDISFKYPGKEENVLKNVSLTIEKGLTIGIIGASGGGKTTLLNILLRLYEESSGGIYVDGKRIVKENISNWYKLVSYVPQNITLLDATVADNIAFGIEREEIDEARIREVIKLSQLDDFIIGLEKGIHTQIGEKGVKISGGQRQRIGIARALYHGGKIIIFDEATSSLDTETERELTEAINHISHKDYTIIIVAHRMQTLLYCDLIYKLHNGQLSLNTNSTH